MTAVPTHHTSIPFLLSGILCLFFVIQLYCSLHVPDIPIGRRPLPRSSTTTHVPQHQPTRRNKKPRLGILLDAGRFAFDTSWLEQQFAFYQQIPGLDVVHFRLSDDPRNILHVNHDTDAAALTQIVHAANARGLYVLPELDVPGHAASWGNTIVVPCPQYTCDTLFGVPLRTDTEATYVQVAAYIERIQQIFGQQRILVQQDDGSAAVEEEQPFLLHLGGDEVHVGDACVKEAGLTASQNYTYFEERLQLILEHQGLSESQIIRWQTTNIGHTAPPVRVVGLPHYWHDAPPPASSSSAPSDYVVSTGLYWDTVANQILEPDAYSVYVQARRYYSSATNQHHHPPRMVIATAFEMNADVYLRRNVPGKLIALGMAYNDDDDDDDTIYANRSDFAAAYTSICLHTILPQQQQQQEDLQSVGKNSTTTSTTSTICNAFGRPLDTGTVAETQRLWNHLRRDVCQRLGVRHITRASFVLQPPPANRLAGSST